MDEAKLIDKLRRIEALFAGAATKGEKDSADRARQRILDRLKSLQGKRPPEEFRFSFPDMWSRKVFIALLRRYDLSPYRYRRQRHTTVMVRVQKDFVKETLLPEYRQISEELRSYLEEVSDRVVAQVLNPDVSDAEVVEEPGLLHSGERGKQSAGTHEAAVDLELFP